MKMKDFMTAIRHASIAMDSEFVIASLNDDCAINEEEIAGVFFKDNKVFIVKDKNDWDYLKRNNKI